MNELKIEFSKFQHIPDIGPEPEALTVGKLKISAGETLLTELFDHLISPPVRQSGPSVSAYPLAQWLATNWWRLRCETMPDDEDPDTDWWMSHQMTDAGYGYLWPVIVIWRQDDHLMTQALPTTDRHSHIQYTGANDAEPIAISLESFDRTVDELFAATTATLEAAGHTETEMHILLADLREERSDPELAALRAREAANGQDPPYANDP